jgi:hypothetical protein
MDKLCNYSQLLRNFTILIFILKESKLEYNSKFLRIISQIQNLPRHFLIQTQTSASYYPHVTLLYIYI